MKGMDEMICLECPTQHNGEYHEKFCSKRCYYRNYQKAYNKKRKAKLKEVYDMRQVTPNEAITNLLCAMIQQAVWDATDTFRQYTNKYYKHTAQVWIVNELPHILALTRDMDTEDIENMQHELSLWVRCGCPQDGTLGPDSNGGGRQLGLGI